jgi:hypothetical protein
MFFSISMTLFATGFAGAPKDLQHVVEGHVDIACFIQDELHFQEVDLIAALVLCGTRLPSAS